MENRKIIAELIDIANELDAKDYPIFANNLTKIAQMFAEDDMPEPFGESVPYENLDEDYYPPDTDIEDEFPESYEDWLEELDEWINSINASPEDIDHIKEMDLKQQYNNGILPYTFLSSLISKEPDTTEFESNSYENETPFGIELDGGSDMDY